MFPAIVGEMLNAMNESMAILRSEIDDVGFGPIVGDVAYVNFTFRGKPYSVPIGNPEWCLLLDGGESDKSIALRSFLIHRGRM